MKKQLGFGVVGAGMIAPFHLKAIKDSNDGYAVAVCDVNKQKAEEIASEYRIEAYTDLDQMLLNKDIDVICVATPNHLHRDIVIKSAKSGKHVLTEKPPAMTLEETDEMIKACKNANVKFGCFVQSRIRKAVQVIKNAIESGRFGKLLHADTYMKWYRPQEYYTSDGWRGQVKSGSGVTIAQGFHYIDLLQYLAGPAVKLEAKMNNIGHSGINLEDDVLAQIEYANGAKGVVQFSTALWPGTDVRIEINGTDGIAVMVGETIKIWKFKDQRPEDKDVLNIGNSSQATGAGGAADFGYFDHAVVVQDMINCIGTEKEVVIPVSSVRASLEIVLAMYQSAARNKPVNWPIKDDESVWGLL